MNLHKITNASLFISFDWLICESAKFHYWTQVYRYVEDDIRTSFTFESARLSKLKIRMSKAYRRRRSDKIKRRHRIIMLKYKISRREIYDVRRNNYQGFLLILRPC